MPMDLQRPRLYKKFLEWDAMGIEERQPRTQEAFCAENDVSVPTLIKWRRMGENDGLTDEEVIFKNLLRRAKQPNANIRDIEVYLRGTGWGQKKEEEEKEITADDIIKAWLEADVDLDGWRKNQGVDEVQEEFGVLRSEVLSDTGSGGGEQDSRDTVQPEVDASAEAIAGDRQVSVVDSG